MIGGALIVALCLLVLGRTSEIVGIFVKNQDDVSKRLYLQVNGDDDTNRVHSEAVLDNTTCSTKHLCCGFCD